MAGITNDGAVYITQRPSAGVPAGSPVIGGVPMTNDGAAYVTGNVGGPYALPTMVGRPWCSLTQKRA
jgi:hypothetical protein